MPAAARLIVEKKPRALRKPEKHLEAVEAWARGFVGFFPETGRIHAHWHLPADQRLVDPPWTTTAYQARCAQALVDAALHLVEARPPERKHHKVAAIISWPGMFMSEVDVFFDEDYFRRFEKRDGEHQSWTRLPPGRSLAGELGLRVPGALRERGYRQRISDDDADVFENEVWMIGEEP